MRNWPRVCLPALVAVFPLLVYLPSLRNGFVYDDTVLIINTPSPSSLRDVTRVLFEPHFQNLPYYRPAAKLTFVLQKAAHGTHPAPFHAFNVALASLAAYLTYLLLRTPAFGIPPAWAALTATAFLAHPVASSVVFPISSGRETLLPGVFTIAAVSLHLRSGLLPGVVAVGFFSLALLSKEQAVVVPLLFLLCDVLRLSDGPGVFASRRIAVRYGGTLAVLVAYLSIRQALFGGTEYAPGSVRLFLASFAYGIQTIAFPFWQLVYEPQIDEWLSHWRLATGVVLALTLAVWLIRERSLDRRVVLFWAGWFFVTLLPTTNLLWQQARFDERYLWLPSLGALALVAMGGMRAGGLAAIVAIPVFAMATLISSHRAVYFADDIAFSRQWLRTAPGSVDAHYNLAMALASRGQPVDAAKHLREVVRLQPDFAEGHYEMGVVLLRIGDVLESIIHFERAVQLEPAEAVFHNGLTSALERKGR